MILKRQGQSRHAYSFSNRQFYGFDELTISPSTSTSRSSPVLRDATGPVDVIGTSDIVSGSVIAIVLAFTASFLQGRRNSNDFVLAPSQFSNGNTTLSSTVGENDSVSSDDLVFDADSWKEISRPESYVLYNNKLRERESKASSESPFKSERVWVFVALLALFVPIFSVEFFFALSRQFLCGGDPMNQSDWSEFLCSPAMTNLD
jgi:hypothetical protein